MKSGGGGGLPCNVFAYFPEIKGTNEPGMFTCYAHVGQHSTCHENYAKGCKEAEYREYRELLMELIGQGYKDLRIMNKQIFSYHRKPSPDEIKRGYGATHWRDFVAADCVSKSGKVKKWLLADDGMRYY